MALIRVRSSDGSDSDNGTTFALAKATVAGGSGAASIEAAGDLIVVASSHVETSASNTTISLAGSTTTTTGILSVDDSVDPPVALQAGASIETTGNATLAISAATAEGPVILDGLNLTVGDGTGTARLELLAAARAPFTVNGCVLYARANSASCRIQFQNSNTGSTTFRVYDTTIRFSNAASTVRMTGAHLDMRGGGLHGSTTSPTNLFDVGFNSQHVIRWVGGDLSAAGTGMNLCAATGVNASFDAVFRRMKLPSGWTGGLSASGNLGPSRIELHESMAGTTPINLWVRTTQGGIRDEQTIVNNDTTAGESHKMVSTTLCGPLTPLVGHEIAVPNTTTGSAITLTLSLVTDGVTLTDGDFWIQARYLDSSGHDQYVTCQVASILATPANLDTNSADWTTTGLSSPTKQEVSVTLTPGSAGYILITPFLGKASTTVYLDPSAVVT